MSSCLRGFITLFYHTPQTESKGKEGNEASPGVILNAVSPGVILNEVKNLIGAADQQQNRSFAALRMIPSRGVAAEQILRCAQDDTLPGGRNETKRTLCRFKTLESYIKTCVQ